MSRRFCRTFCRPWRVRSADLPRRSQCKRRATPSASLASMNLAHLVLRAARLQPDAPAIALGKHLVRTYGELAERVARLAAGLRATLNLLSGGDVSLEDKSSTAINQV